MNAEIVGQSSDLSPRDEAKLADDIKLKIEQMTERAFKPIETPEDIQDAIEFLTLVSPEFAGKIFQLLEEQGIPITVDDSIENSKATKSLYSILNRNSVYAKSITLRKEATLFELIHEATHSVPLKLLPQPLDGIEAIAVDVSQTVEELTEVLVKVGHLEEAVALASEAVLVQELEAQGIYVNYDEFAPGIREAYERGGVPALSDELTDLIPWYGAYLGAMAEKTAPDLKRPAAELLTIPWDEHLDGYGIKLSQKGEEGISVSVDPEAFSASFNDLVANMTTEKAQSLVSGIADKLKQYMEEREAGFKKLKEAHPPTEVVSLAHIYFENRPNPNGLSNQRLYAEKANTISRVEVAGQYHDFVKSSKKAQNKEASFFSERLKIAESFYGEHSAQMYRELLADAQVKDDDGNEYHDNIKNLGMSLLKSGYLEQGQQVMAYFLAEHNTRYRVNELVRIADQLLPYESYQLVVYILDIIEERYSEERSLLEVFIDAYDFKATFTERGLAILKQRFAEENPTTQTMFEVVVALHESGDFVAKEGWEGFALEKPLRDSYEKDFYTDQVKSSAHARDLHSLAEKLTQQPDLSERIRRLTTTLARKAMIAAQRSFIQKLEHASAEFELPLQTGNDSTVAGFIRRLEGLHDSNDVVAYASYLRDEIKTVGRNLKDMSFLFDEVLSFMEQFEGSIGIVDVLKDISEAQVGYLSVDQINRLLSIWNKAVLEASYAISLSNYCEKEESTEVRKKLFLRDTRVRPEALSDMHFSQEQNLAMAKILLASPLSMHQELGQELVDSIGEKETHFFNPREYISPQNSFFSKPTGYTIHKLYTFDQREFKAHALIEASKLDETNSDRWVMEAFDVLIYMSIDFSKNELFPEADNLLCRHYEVFEALLEKGWVDKAHELLRRMERFSSTLSLTWENKQKEFNALSAKDKLNGRAFDSFNLERFLETARFFEQDIQSRLKAKLANAFALLGMDEEALEIAQNLNTSFEKEISGRRTRFDIRSMVISARQIADAPGFNEQAKVAFELAIAKAALSRGEESVFENGINLLFENIDQSKLDAQIKDVLLAKLVVEMSPGKITDWGSMGKSVPSLLQIAKAISNADVYPIADAEATRIIHGIAMEAAYARDDSFSSFYKLKALESIYEFLGGKYSEIFVSDFNTDLVQLSEEPQYKAFLLQLHPELSEVLFGGALVENGFFDLEKIKNRFYEQDELYTQLATELTLILDSPSLSAERGEHLMQVYELVIQQELMDFRDQKESKYKMEISDLDQIKGISFLKELFETSAFVNQNTTELQMRAIQALLHAANSEEAVGKRALYIYFLGEESVVIDVQSMAFDGLIKTGEVSEYLVSFYEENVVGRSEDELRAFYEVIKFFLSSGEKVPADLLLIQLFEGSTDKKEMLDVYYEASQRKTVPDEITDPITNSKKRLGSFFTGTKAEYLALRQEFIEKSESWVPQLDSYNDLLIAYEQRFSWFMPFSKFVESLRGLFIFDAYNLEGPFRGKFNFTPEQVVETVRMFDPHLKYGQEELDAIQEIFDFNKKEYAYLDSEKYKLIPKNRGTISYFQLIDEVFPNMELTQNQINQLIEVLNRTSDESELEILFRTFGPVTLSDGEKQWLSEFLNQAKDKFLEQNDKTTQTKVETPKVFDEMPEVVQFALKRFFKLLPYGERQAVLSELNESIEGLTPQAAIRRFFEVTGGEKIGQFLSSRRDFVPEEYRRELEKFQQNVEASSFDEVESTIEAELGQSLGEVFATFKREPLNVGTIGEVYEATLNSGEKVAVKVITPSKRKLITKMLSRLESVCNDVERNKSRFPGAYDPVAMFKEFKRTMNIETDFRLEYESAEDVRRTLPKGVSIPKYFGEFVKESVLVQSYAEGVHIDEVSQPKVRQKALDTLGSMLLNQLLDIGTFHDDLHPGNIRVNPENGDLQLLDFGRVGTLSDSERQNIMPLLMAARAGQAENFVNLMEKVGSLTTNFDKIGLLQAAQKVMESSDGNMSVTISKMFLECGKHGLKVNSSYLQVLKSVMTFEGTAQQLDPNFNMEQFLMRVGRGRILGMLGSWFRG